MHIPILLGSLRGMKALATSMMKKEMEKLDIPPVDEFLEMLTASGVKMWGGVGYGYLPPEKRRPHRRLGGHSYSRRYPQQGQP